MNQRIWIVSEFYYPEENATGYLLTKIAEGLASEFHVNVVCGYPVQEHQRKAPAKETRNGVQIFRCLSTGFSKDILIFRFINVLTVSISIFLALVRRLLRNERVLVVTNPPLLPFIAVAACMLKGAFCSVLTYDVYPEVLVAAGVVRPNGIVSSSIEWLNRLLYRGAKNVIVLGRDMFSRVSAKGLNVDHRVVLIPNWADVQEIAPSTRSKNPILKEFQISSKFVVQYLGNMGRTHGIEQLLECMTELSQENRIHFLFIGEGAKKQWLQEAIARKGLSNVTLIPYRSRSEHAIIQNACDLAVISMLPGMSGVSMPSRLYNIMAAGKPVIVIAENDSELARVVEEEAIGWVVAPGRTNDLIAAILKGSKNLRLLQQMGKRARAAAERKYTFQKSLSLYSELLQKTV